MEPKFLSDKELFLSLIPGWGLVKKLKDKIFKRQTGSGEFQARIGRVVDTFRIKEYVPGYSRPYFIMLISQSDFRKILVEHKPPEIFVTDTRYVHFGSRGEFHFHADVDIVIASRGFVEAQCNLGVLNDLPYTQVEHKGFPSLNNWARYIRSEP